MTTENDRAIFMDRHDVSRETMDKLDRIIETLDEWRIRSNLIGPKEWPNIWERHVWDCLQLTDHIEDGARICDLGSGAGFPGLILAAAVPGVHVTLIETSGKKCDFLRAAIDAAGLPARVIQGRVENTEGFDIDIVTARAFAPLPKLLEFSSVWMENGANGLFSKGERWQEELTAAQQSWTFAYDATPSRSGNGVILKVRELQRGIEQA